MSTNCKGGVGIGAVSIRVSLDGNKRRIRLFRGNIYDSLDGRFIWETFQPISVNRFRGKPWKMTI